MSLTTLENTVAVKRAVIHRLAFVDALRGAAALYVIIFHMVIMPQHLPVAHWLEVVLRNGATGVTLFFVLSAFTLCYTLHVRQDEPQQVERFYIRRIFRIVPLYYCWLIVMIVRDFRVGWFKLGPLPGKQIALWALFGYNLVPGEQEGIVWASWTLGVEMLVYLAFPLIFRFVSTGSRSALFLVGSAALALGNYYFAIHFISHEHQDRWLDLSVFSQLPVFAAGVIAFFLYRYLNDHERMSQRVGIPMLGIGFLGFLLVPAVTHNLSVSSLGRVYPMAAVYALILLGLAFAPFKILVNRFTVLLGTLSYSIYLNHPLLTNKLQPLYRRIYQAPGGDAAHLVVCASMSLSILIAISWLTYKVVEQPGIWLGSNIIKRRSGEKHGSR